MCVPAMLHKVREDMSVNMGIILNMEMILYLRQHKELIFFYEQ